MPSKRKGKSRGKGRGSVPESSEQPTRRIGEETRPGPSRDDRRTAERSDTSRILPSETAPDIPSVSSRDVSSQVSQMQRQISRAAETTSAPSETAVETLTRAMQRFGLEVTYKDDHHRIFAVRPGIGKRGRKINLIANYFPIDLPQGEVYHYDVEIDKIRQEPKTDIAAGEKPTHKKYKCLNTKVKRKVIEEMVRVIDMFKNIRPAYDGEKNLYTRRSLPIKTEKAFHVNCNDESERSETYEIRIKPVNRKDAVRSAENWISLEPLHQLMEGRCHNVTEDIIMGIMAMETILRHGPALRLVPVGRSFFQKPTTEELPILGGGREIWFGHHQNIQVCNWKPMFNMDRSATTFYKSCPLIDFMMEILYPNSEADIRQIRGLTDANRRVLKKELKNLKVQVTHLPYPRKYRIFDITKENASNTFFIREINGIKKPCSVSDYFGAEYRRLKYPNLPCIDVGSDKRHVYLPMEVCEIVEGQHCNKKLTDKQTSEIIRFTAIPPAERFREIQNSMKTMMEGFAPFSKEFGIRISPNPLNFIGRMLDPPNIMYNQQQQIRPSNGSWDMRGKKFYEGVNIDHWMLLSFSSSRFCNQNSLENFAVMLRNGGRNVGVNFAQPEAIKIFQRRDGKPSNIIKQAKRIQTQLQLVIVVLPADGSEIIYSEIKSIAETEIGLMTQCIKDVNTSGRKCNPQLICNLCQKINAKMGGVNNSLVPADRPPVLNKPVIIIGADCTHPTPGAKIGFSIAAAVGSLDRYPSRFKASVRVQSPKIREGTKSGQDIIIDLKDMVKDLFMEFYNKTKGKKPEKIIFYRDGVSEGEYTKVLDFELKAVREACKEIAKGEPYKPPITFIVCGKRHHTRFTPADRREGVGKHANIPPGTTVDTDVVHPVFFDFYLCSHTGIQGTSRPAHYTVLWDDNNFSADELQTLTYYLCHTYVRCTRSISIPCPVMYADLAAYRAKQYLTGKIEEMSSSSSETSEAATEVIINESIKQAITVVENMQNRMYFV